MGRKKESDTPATDNVIGLAERVQAKSRIKENDEPAMVSQTHIFKCWWTLIEREMFKLDTVIKCCQQWQGRSNAMKGPERLRVLLELSSDLSDDLQEKFKNFRDYKAACDAEDPS